MGGKGGRKKGPNAGIQSHVSMTLREESSGNVNAKTMCKLDHLKNLAMWTATKASFPSLGAFFGQRVAATAEALGLRADPSVFLCERCESVLQPGQNCTVRIEKSNIATQNNVVYTCHLCSHRNLMRGTPKGHVKAICPPKAKLKSAAEERNTSLAKCTSIATVVLIGHNVETSSPTTCLSLLDSKRRKRNRLVAKKAEMSCTEKSAHESSKRRRKTWTSLKEIARKQVY